jgi:hypothetical protein
MARDESADPQEKEGLSARIRDLILGANVEERRKPDTGESAGPNAEQRRRTDPADEGDRAS